MRLIVGFYRSDLKSQLTFEAQHKVIMAMLAI